MTDAVDRLGEAWLEEAKDQPEEQVQEVTEQVGETQPEPIEQEPQAETQQEAQPEREEKFNPTLYKEMKEERRKRQELEKQIEALKAQQPVQKQEPVKIPDAYTDPDAFADYFGTQVERVKWEAKAEISGFRAEQQFGKETVEAAIQWAQQQAAVDPTLEARVTRSASPVEYVVHQYQQSRTLESLAGKTPEDFAKDYAIQQGWIVSQPGAQPSQQKPSLPPRSLASVPGSGGHSAVTPEADWGGVKFALDR